MKAVRLENFKTKTPPGKSAEEWRRKKKNLTGTGWSSAPAESRRPAEKDTGTAGTPERRRRTTKPCRATMATGTPTRALQIKPPPMPPQETAEQDAQGRARAHPRADITDRRFTASMESKRTLPQRLAAQGITGGLTESSQVRLANSYGEELAENESASCRGSEAYSARDARLAAARAEPR